MGARGGWATRRRVAGAGLLAAGMLAGAPWTASGDDAVRGPVRAVVVSVYDGDTFTADVAPWPGWTVRTAVRVRGVDTPEIRGACAAEKAAAIAARDFAADALGAGGDVAAPVALADIEPDKYGGRVVATVHTARGELAALLIAAGHGRPYAGGRRTGWC